MQTMPVNNTTPVAVEKTTLSEQKPDSFEKTQTEENKPKKQNDIVSFIESKVVNPRDINDTVTMPRAIFKGYLCFTAGTAIGAIASNYKNSKPGRILNAASAALTVLGTYNFVKPFIFKGEQTSKSEK